MSEHGKVGVRDLTLSPVDDVPTDPGSREDRVRAIMDLMADLRWENGVTSVLLADRWSLNPGTVSAMAGEASRRLKAVIDPVYVRTKLGNALDRAVSVAIEKNDVKGLALVAKVYSDVTGATAPKKHEHTGADGAPLGLPPRAALLLEAAKSGNVRAKAMLEQWVMGDEDDAPALPLTASVGDDTVQ